MVLWGAKSTSYWRKVISSFASDFAATRLKASFPNIKHIHPEKPYQEQEIIDFLLEGLEDLSFEKALDSEENKFSTTEMGWSTMITQKVNILNTLKNISIIRPREYFTYKIWGNG